jgi:dienelactone hydrolase
MWELIWGFGYFMLANDVKAAWPRVESFTKALRTDQETSNLPVGAAGFCWGGLYALKLTQEDAFYELQSSNANQKVPKKPLVDAAFMAHPQPIPHIDAEKVVQPISGAIGSKDWATSVERIGELRKILETRAARGVHTEIITYDGAGHGFAIRYDPKNPNMATQAEQAQDQAVTWFKHYFI